MSGWERFWSTSNRQAPVSDEVFVACEAEFGVTFPESFRQLWQVHNGGAGGLTFLPLAAAGTRERVCPVTELASQGALIDAETLDEIADVVGDPRLLIVLAFDGAYCYVLNFNANGPHGMPSVGQLDLGGNFMFGGWEPWAATFDGFAANARGQ